MRRQVYKLIFFIFFIFLLLSGEVFAATSYSQSASNHREGTSSAGSSTCTSQQIYNQALTLKNTLVKFTQNDTEYIFDITADSSIKFFGNVDYCKPNYLDIPQPILYKSENFSSGMIIEESSKVPFVDYTGEIYLNSLLKINNKEIEYVYTSSDVAPNWINYKDNIKRNNGDKYFIPNSARAAALSSTYNYSSIAKYPSGLENNGDDVRLISNSSNKTFTLIMFDRDGNGEQEYIDTVNVTISVKIAIEKSSIDDYRYICFICNEVGHTNVWQKTGSYASNGYSLSTNTIDLKNFTTCNHSWSVTESDAANHTIKCANCEWKKTEAHDYKFEYDGIANDVCVCSRVKQVKYHYEINDDYNASVDKTLNTNSTCEKVEVKAKTGYNFKWYEKYELKFDNDNLFNLTSNKISATKVFLNNTTAIDSTTGSRSIFYKAIYSPIKYIFNYSSKASTKDYISKRLNKSISPQTFYYDTKDYLKDHSKYDYLIFKGWTLTEGSQDIDFLSKAEILNYSKVDLSEFTIYPIYEAMEYKILYNTVSGKYEGDTQQVSKTYDYYVDEDFLKPSDMGKNKTFSHYADMNGNEFTDMNALRNFIKDEAGDSQTIILFAMSKTIDGSVDDESGSTTPQSQDDQDNNDSTKTDGGDKDTNTNGTSTKDSSKNDNTSDTSTANNDKSNTNSNQTNTNTSSLDSKDKSSTKKEDSTSDTQNKSTNDSNNANSNSSSSSNSYPSGSSGGGSGGSNNSPLKIKSFPEDKYTGPGVVNGFTDIIKAEAKVSAPLINAPQYLYNENNELKKSNEMNNRNSVKDGIEKNEKNKKDDEEVKEVFGPPLIDFENKINYRGLHGPWYYEKEYVDRILREREERLREIEIEEELKLKKIKSENNFKHILIAAFGSLFIILIIIFEIFNIKQMKKNK